MKNILFLIVAIFIFSGCVQVYPVAFEKAEEYCGNNLGVDYVDFTILRYGTDRVVCTNGAVFNKKINKEKR